MSEVTAEQPTPGELGVIQPFKDLDTQTLLVELESSPQILPGIGTAWVIASCNIPGKIDTKKFGFENPQRISLKIQLSKDIRPRQLLHLNSNLETEVRLPDDKILWGLRETGDDDDLTTITFDYWDTRERIIELGINENPNNPVKPSPLIVSAQDLPNLKFRFIDISR